MRVNQRLLQSSLVMEHVVYVVNEERLQQQKAEEEAGLLETQQSVLNHLVAKAGFSAQNSIVAKAGYSAQNSVTEKAVLISILTKNRDKIQPLRVRPSWTINCGLLTCGGFGTPHFCI